MIVEPRLGVANLGHLAVLFSLGQQGPNNASIFIGHRDARPIDASVGSLVGNPLIPGIGFGPGSPDNSSGSMDEQGA